MHKLCRHKKGQNEKEQRDTHGKTEYNQGEPADGGSVMFSPILGSHGSGPCPQPYIHQIQDKLYLIGKGNGREGRLVDITKH